MKKMNRFPKIIMPKSKPVFDSVKLKKGNKIVSFDPLTKTRDMAKESIMNNEHGSSMMLGGQNG